MTSPGSTTSPTGKQPEENAIGVPEMIEDFIPMQPQVAVQTASQRLQHIRVSPGSHVFGYVVAQQWRVDSAARRNTWAVLDTSLECKLLNQDLLNGVAPEELASSRDAIIIADDDTHCEGSSVGQLKIMTFQTLVSCLGKRFAQGWQWRSKFGSPTIVMNFGWGNMTSEMAVACLGVAKLIEKNLEVAIMACTVSSCNRNPFGSGQRWKLIRVQSVKVRKSAARLQPKGLDQPVTTIGRDARLALVADKLGELDKKIQMGEERKAILLIIDEPDADDIPVALNEFNFQFLKDISQLKEFPGKHLALDARLSYTGRIANVSDIVVYPYTTAYVEDRGQVVRREGITPKSRREIWYRSRDSFGPDVQPQTHILMEKKELEMFPKDDETSTAHTVNLPRVLLCGMLLWEGVPLAEMPVSLPRNMVLVEEQIRRLVRKRIIRVVSSGPSPGLMYGLGLLYGRTALTDMGRITARMLVMGGIESLHSACLLGQLMSEEGRQRVGLTLEAPVIDAIFAIAAVTETKNGITNIQNTFSLVREGEPGPKKWYKNNLSGVAADQVCRGPIWLAVAIWQKLRDDPTWRGDWQAFEAAIPDHQGNQDTLTVNKGFIMISTYSSVNWDAALAKMNGVRVSGVPSPGLRENSRLTSQALFAVEKAMVFAFLDKIACVSCGNEFLAWDLLTQQKLAKPVKWQWGQVWLDDCLTGDSLDGRRPPVAFCIYTDLQYVEDDDGGIWRPYEVTYVSFGAVCDVLTEVGYDLLLRSIMDR